MKECSQEQSPGKHTAMLTHTGTHTPLFTQSAYTDIQKHNIYTLTHRHTHIHTHTLSHTHTHTNTRTHRQKVVLHRVTAAGLVIANW